MATIKTANEQIEDAKKIPNSLYDSLIEIPEKIFFDLNKNQEIAYNRQITKSLYNYFNINSSKNFIEEITKTYPKKIICEICCVSHSTVYNWINKNNMPMWAIEKLGFKVFK